MSIFTEELNRQLHQISTFLQEDIKQILIDDGHRATGELVNSIKNTVSQGSSMFVIEGHMAKQGEYIIRGRKEGAKGIPIDALIKWIQNKNFSSGITSTKGLAFAIQRVIKFGKFDKNGNKIKEGGIKPDDFIGKVFDKNSAYLDSKLNKAVERALNLSLTNLVNNSKQFA